uniref:SEA domain-containing protein n=1 Tax=Eptatretus burgeri TaxID=7764 RepID=A0A8C4QBB7_EPTBU
MGLEPNALQLLQEFSTNMTIEDKTFSNNNVTFRAGPAGNWMSRQYNDSFILQIDRGGEAMVNGSTTTKVSSLATPTNVHKSIKRPGEGMVSTSIAQTPAPITATNIHPILTFHPPYQDMNKTPVTAQSELSGSKASHTTKHRPKTEIKRSFENVSLSKAENHIRETTSRSLRWTATSSMEKPISSTLWMDGSPPAMEVTKETKTHGEIKEIFDGNDLTFSPVSSQSPSYVDQYQSNTPTHQQESNVVILAPVGDQNMSVTHKIHPATTAVMPSIAIELPEFQVSTAKERVERKEEELSASTTSTNITFIASLLSSRVNTTVENSTDMMATSAATNGTVDERAIYTKKKYPLVSIGMPTGTQQGNRFAQTATTVAERSSQIQVLKFTSSDEAESLLTAPADPRLKTITTLTDIPLEIGSTSNRADDVLTSVSSTLRTSSDSFELDDVPQDPDFNVMKGSSEATVNASDLEASVQLYDVEIASFTTTTPTILLTKDNRIKKVSEELKEFALSHGNGETSADTNTDSAGSYSIGKIPQLFDKQPAITLKNASTSLPAPASPASRRNEQLATTQADSLNSDHNTTWTSSPFEKSTSTSDLVVFFSLRVTNIHFSDELFNKSSQEYKSMKQKFINLLVPYISENLSGFRHLDILGFQQGSVVVRSRVRLGEPLPQNATQTLHHLLNDICGAALHRANRTLDCTAVNVKIRKL